MKTIIATNEMKDTILRKMAQENNGIIKDVQVLPLTALLQEEKDDTIVLLLQLSSLLQQNKSAFPIYAPMFLYPSFIQEILSFIREFILYEVDLKTLPETNAQETELKAILQIASTLDLAEKQNIQHKTNLSTVKDILLYYQFIQDAYHYDIYQQLSKTYPTYSYPKQTPTVQIRYALHARNEAEAIAQDICNNNQPCNIILTDVSTQLPLYESVLERYQIPFTSLRQSKQLHITKAFQALLLFGVHKNKDTFLDALKYNAFSMICPRDVYAFYQDTMIDMSFPTPLNIQDDLFNKEISSYNTIQTKAEAYQQTIQDDIQALLDASTPSAIIYKAFDILRKCKYVEDELDIALTIRTTLISSIPTIHTNEDVIFLARTMDTIQKSEMHYESDFCTITDLTHPIEAKYTSYVVACSGANYPNVPTNTGLFDESYVEKVNDYPSRAKRYDLYMQQLEWIQHSATHTLYFSYFTNDYQGREMQLAFDIENMYSIQSEKWPLVSLKPFYKETHQLDETTSKALFEKNNKIIASISTVERYFNCPYSYFLYAGLRAYDTPTSFFDVRNFGNIEHKFFEERLKQYGKQYTSIENILEDITPYFETLNALHPTTIFFHEMTKQRMIAVLQTACTFLQDFESHTSYEPKHAEYPFLFAITDHITIRGIIDRIDQYRDEFLRVIDYKSSSHTLSEDKVKAGTQLQLLTYIIVVQALLSLKGAGAYYFSLKNDSHSTIARKKGRKEIEETEWDEASIQQRFISQRRLKGWTFTDRTTEIDDNGQHIVTKQYDIDSVHTCLIAIYDYFYQQLMQGTIEVSPTEEACMFCKYQSICQFHGEKRKAKPLVMIDQKLAVGKE